MTDITIPPAALEAAARQICGYERDQDVEWREYIGHARAAFLAMLSAWPGKDIVGYGPPFYGIDLIPPLRRTPMLKPEQVPTQVIEAFRVALKNDDTKFAEDFCIALNAWPGAFWHEFGGALDGTGIVLPVAHRLPPPLPTAASDE